MFQVFSGSVLCIEWFNIVVLNFFKPVKLFIRIDNEGKKQDLEQDGKQRGRYGLFCCKNSESESSHNEFGEIVCDMQCGRSFDSSGVTADKTVNDSGCSDVDDAGEVVWMNRRKCSFLCDQTKNRQAESAADCLIDITSVHQFFRSAQKRH